MMEGSTAARTKRRLMMILILGSISLLVLFTLYLTIGQYQLGFTDALSALAGYFGHLGSPADQLNGPEKVVGLIRLPRALAVIGVGIALSVAGAIMQAMIRNPLVDPYITGVSSGAALGATTVMISGITLMGLSAFAVPLAAFAGALLAFFFTMSLAEGSGGRSLNYVLAGIIVGTALSSIVNLMISIFPQDVHGVLFWLFGNFNSINWTQTALILIPALIVSVIALLYARELNVILLGHEQAYQLGVDSRKFRQWMMILSSVLTAVAVAFVGIIGFLGLIVPHIARIVVGGDHRLLLPASMIIGANVLLAADIVARTATTSELPVGAIISLIGAPFFGYLLIRRGKEYAG